MLNRPTYSKAQNKDWNRFDFNKRQLLLTRAWNDPVFFNEHPAFFQNSKLFAKQAQIMREFYGNPMFKELILVAGMRGGKTYLAGRFQCYEAFKLINLGDAAAYYNLAPGSEIFLINVATSDDQAKDTIFAKTKEAHEHSPYFNWIGFTARARDIRYHEPYHKIICRSAGSNSASIAGRTAKSVAFDELERFEDTEGRRSGWMCYDTLTRAVATFKQEGHIFVISSALSPFGIMMQLYNKSKVVKSMTGHFLKTWELSDQITRTSLQDAYDKNPIAAARDFECDVRAASTYYIMNIDAFKINYDKLNVFEHDELKDDEHSYILAGDPSVRRNSFGFALGHLENGTYHIDGLTRFTPQRGKDLDAKEIRGFVYDLLKRFNIEAVIFDVPTYPELQQDLEDETEVVNHIVRLEDFERVKELWSTGDITVCDYPFVLEEWGSLIKRKNKIEPAKGSSKDVIDSMCNVVWHLWEHQEDTHPFNIVEVI